MEISPSSILPYPPTFTMRFSIAPMIGQVNGNAGHALIDLPNFIFKVDFNPIDFFTERLLPFEKQVKFSVDIFEDHFQVFFPCCPPCRFKFHNKQSQSPKSQAFHH